ncbi:MAG: YbgT family membrane protein [Francisellaceae bacterium]
MFYIVWIVSAFVAVGVGCWAAGLCDRKNPEEE